MSEFWGWMVSLAWRVGLAALFGIGWYGSPEWIQAILFALVCWYSLAADLRVDLVERKHELLDELQAKREAMRRT